MKLRLATRGSHLARSQAAGVARKLAGLGHEIDLSIVTTAGDRSTATSFGAIGPRGVFVRDIERALLAGDADIAVHSHKDLPTDGPPELTVAAVPARLDPADVLVTTRAATAASGQVLPIVEGARVGTASARRQAWVRRLRPDIRVAPVRGNVPTRIGRLRTDLDGVVLAAAGLERLRASPLDDVTDPAMGEFLVHRLPPERFVPAPAQGALAIQCRRADADIRQMLQALDHAATRQATQTERALLARLEGGCDLAFGAWCTAGESRGGGDEPGPNAGESRDGGNEYRPGGNGEPRACGNNESRGGAAGSASGSLRLIACLEHDGALRRADTRRSNPAALVAAAWAQLERPWAS